MAGGTMSLLLMPQAPSYPHRDAVPLELDVASCVWVGKTPDVAAGFSLRDTHPDGCSYRSVGTLCFLEVRNALFVTSKLQPLLPRIDFLSFQWAEIRYWNGMRKQVVNEVRLPLGRFLNKQYHAHSSRNTPPMLAGNLDNAVLAVV